MAVRLEARALNAGSSQTCPPPAQFTNIGCVPLCARPVPTAQAVQGERTKGLPPVQGLGEAEGPGRGGAIGRGWERRRPSVESAAFDHLNGMSCVLPVPRGTCLDSCQPAICRVSSGDTRPPAASLAMAQTTCMKARGEPLGTATCWVLKEGTGVPRQHEGL